MVHSDDDSDASFQDSKKTSKRPSPKAYQDLSDDSDSDDDLLLASKPTFRSSSRLRNNKKPKVDSHLEDALKSRSIKMETQISMQRKIQKTKQELSSNFENDELLESAKALQVQRDADQKQRAKEKAEQTQQELQILQQQANTMDGAAPAPRKRNDWWLEIRDTELTRSIDTHFGCCLNNTNLQDCRHLPDSIQTAKEYLEFVLKGNKTKVAKALGLHLKQGTLADFMMHKGLLRIKDVKTLPNPLLQWMLEVAVATCNPQEEDDVEFDKLSRGAYQTLVQLWSTGKGGAAKGCLLAIDDLPVQLKEWFGIDLSKSTAADNKTNPKSPTSVLVPVTTSSNKNSIPKSLVSVSIIRFLHLWQLALEHNMVYFDNDNDDSSSKQHDVMSDAVLALLLVSLDPAVMESTETLASYQPSAKVRHILGHLLQQQETMKKNNTKDVTWTSRLATRILDHVGSGGGGKAPAQQETVWSDYSRVVRCLCHTQGSSGLVAHLCERLVAQVSENSNHSSQDQNKPSSTLNWDAYHQELGSLPGWSAFSTISIVVFRLVESLPNQGVETKVPAALVELLLEAIMMALGRLEIGVRGSTTTGDSTTSSNNLDPASKYAFFHLLDTVLVELTTKSKALTSRNPDYLKVNYHASCFRQYTRLETQKYKITEQQSTLDGFFTKLK